MELDFIDESVTVLSAAWSMECLSCEASDKWNNEL